MTLKWVEGYESYSNLISWVQYRYPTYTVPNASFQPGRAIGNSFLMNGNIFATPNLGNNATWTVGFAFQNVNLAAANTNMPVLEIRDSTTAQITLTFNPSTRVFSVFRGTTSLGVGTFVITTGYWYYIELKVFVDPAVGTVQSRVNTVNDVAFSGNTQVSANNFANTIAFRGPTAAGIGGGYLIDDLYINNGAGAVNNSFLGDMKVESVNVIAGGVDTQWGVNVPNTPNYQAVQVLADGIYIQSNTVNDQDFYVTSALNRITGSIAGVSSNYWARNTDSTQHSISASVYIAGTPYQSSAFFINNTAFNEFSNIFETNPATLAAWTVGDVNTTQFGVLLVS